MMKKCVPLARENARIVLLSSMACWQAQLSFTPQSNPLAREINLVNRSLTLERLEELATKFVSDAKENKYKEAGWPDCTEPFDCLPISSPHYPAYSTSKLFVNGITRVYG